MANTYDTRHLPLGTQDPYALYNNASNGDEALNSPAPSWVDRFGNPRKTWAGIETDFAAWLLASGSEPVHLVYVAGQALSVQRPTQLIDYSGSVYRVKMPATFPVTLTGSWASDAAKLVDVGDQSLRQSLAAPGGAGLIGDSLYGTLVKRLNGIRRVSIHQFAITGQTRWDDAVEAAIAYSKAQAQRVCIVFPSGLYEFNNTHNYAIQDGAFIGEGQVIFRYYGTDNALSLDAGSAAENLCYNMTFGPFIIQAPSTAKHGLYVRSIHHSDIDVTVRGAGSSSAGVCVEFAVCTTFRVTVSVNDEGWYLNAKPAEGLRLNARAAPEQTAYCLFPNAIIEGPTTGINMLSALGCNFVGGTSEGCGVGLSIGVISYCNKFFGMDFEANKDADILCRGHENDFFSVDSLSYSIFQAGSRNNYVIGGNFAELDMPDTGFGNVASTVRGNRLNSGATISVAGTNRRINCYDVAANSFYPDIDGPRAEIAYDPPQLLNNGITQATVNVVGAQLGMFASASFDKPLAGLELSTWVSATGSVIVQLINRTGATIDLPAGKLSVKLTQ